ncbi:MAG: ribosome biogenesis GTP-binding protein YihA/YsxC [Thermodesulfobacteriota bacterium]|nr:ribosome biogenesis GTP-binding protein YihA/YsxC [Thermodesulfobacteriota bacterium]
MEVEFLKSSFHKHHYPPPDRPEIAFAGRSNVGKSSLINVLVNRKKMAKTSSRPGRTQAINFFIADNRLYLVDLPGYGFARVPLQVKESWGEMVETYLQRRTNLKAVVVILDIRRDLNYADMNLLDWLDQYGINTIIVLTKADKLSRNKSIARSKLIGSQLEKISTERPTVFSAKTNEGREDIWRKINRAIET